MPDRRADAEPPEKLEQMSDRLRRARRAYEARHGDVTYEELGVRVAEVLGRREPFSRQHVSHWFSGRTEPSFSQGCALAKVLEADPMLVAIDETAMRPLVPFLREKPPMERVLTVPDEPVTQERNRRSHRRRRHA